jgi:hypothetical protein
MWKSSRQAVFSHLWMLLRLTSLGNDEMDASAEDKQSVGGKHRLHDMAGSEPPNPHS